MVRFFLVLALVVVCAAEVPACGRAARGVSRQRAAIFAVPRAPSPRPSGCACACDDCSCHQSAAGLRQVAKTVTRTRVVGVASCARCGGRQCALPAATSAVPTTYPPTAEGTGVDQAAQAASDPAPHR